MSSIDEQQKKALIRFYHTSVLRLPRDTGSAPGPRKGEPAPGSYYRPRQWAPLRRADFEIALGNREEIAAALVAFWDRTPLAGLGGKIAKLSRRFASVRQKSDISPFIYEMF